MQLKEAKNNLSELVRLAESGKPQVITKRGREVAAIISINEYKRLRGQKDSLVQAFRKSPMIGMNLDFSRLDGEMRDEIDFSE